MGFFEECLPGIKPSLDLDVAEDHSGGAFTASKSQAVPMPTLAATCELV